MQTKQTITGNTVKKYSITGETGTFQVSNKTYILLFVLQTTFL